MYSSPLEKLDTILNIISNTNENHTEATLAEKFNVDNNNAKLIELQAIIQKLLKDEYILRQHVKDVSGLKFNYDRFLITFEGLLLIEKGGYFSKYAKERAEIRTNKTIQVVLAVTGAIAAFYYIIEIANQNYGLVYISGGFTLLSILSELYLRKLLLRQNLRKLLLIVTGIIILFTVFKLYNLDKHKQTPQTKSQIKDSLDRIAFRLTGVDFNSLATTDLLNLAKGIQKAAQKYPLSEPDIEAANKRRNLEEKIYEKISDSTIKANQWPDTIMIWVKKNNLQLGRPFGVKLIQLEKHN